MKILHIVADDKFIDMAIREFETVSPGVNEFVMVDALTPFRHVKSNCIRNLNADQFTREVQREDVTAVMFHCLTRDRYRFLEQIPAGKKVFWFGWGQDYYALLSGSFPGGLLFPKTEKLSRPSPIKRLYRTTRSGIKRTLRLSGFYPNDIDNTVLRRVDYFIPVLDSEYHLALKNNSWFKPEYICWNYGTVEDDLSISALAPESVGTNILVGNSATATNNHYEIFVRIREQLELSGVKVIVPLSYGDRDYRNRVLKCGSEILGDSFKPLIDFMPRDEYIRTLNSCGFVMMNHVRQQALGNICISALLGAKIFLNSRNPLHAWLKEKGMVVGNIEHLDANPLTGDERNANIKAISTHWGRQAQREKTRRVVKAALS